MLAILFKPSKIYIHLFFIERRYKLAVLNKIKLRVQDGWNGFRVLPDLSLETLI
jgi:hypothetical protein